MRNRVQENTTHKKHKCMSKMPVSTAFISKCNIQNAVRGGCCVTKEHLRRALLPVNLTASKCVSFRMLNFASFT